MASQNLAKALAKVGDTCPTDDLPSDRNDVLWNKLAEERALTFAELSALKNYRCTVQGMLSSY